MNPLMLIKGELRRSFGGILALALVLALSLSLGVGVSMTERAVRQGTARAGDAFDLLVGAQGRAGSCSGAVYLRPQSLPRWFRGARLRNPETEGVVWAAPLGLRRPLERIPAGGGDEQGYMVTLGGKRTLAQAGPPRRMPCSARASPAARRRFPHARAGFRIRNEHEACRYKAVGRLPAGHAVGQRHPHPPNRSGPSTMRFPAGHGLPSDIFLKGRVPPLPGVSAVVVKPESIAAAYRLRAFLADGDRLRMLAAGRCGLCRASLPASADRVVRHPRRHARHHDRHGLCRAVRGPVRGSCWSVGWRYPCANGCSALRARRAALSGAPASGAWSAPASPCGRWPRPAVRLGGAFQRRGAAHVPRSQGSCSPATYLAEGSFAAASLRSAPCARCSPPIWSIARREPSH